MTYNSAASIGECLDALRPSWTELFELLIVDNASADKTCSIVREHSLAPRLITNHSNVGFATAVNQGCEGSRGGVIVLLNPDTRVEEAFLTKILQTFSAHSETAVIGCNLVDDRGAHQPSCWKTPSLLMVALEVFLPHSFALPLITVNPTTSAEVPMVSGACMGVRRDRFERLGGMDGQFFMYYEDADFCLRIRQQGFKVMFIPGIRVLHRAGGSTTNLESFYL